MTKDERDRCERVFGLEGDSDQSRLYVARNVLYMAMPWRRGGGPRVDGVILLFYLCPRPTLLVQPYPTLLSVHTEKACDPMVRSASLKWSAKCVMQY